MFYIVLEEDFLMIWDCIPKNFHFIFQVKVLLSLFLEKLIEILLRFLYLFIKQKNTRVWVFFELFELSRRIVFLELSDVKIIGSSSELSCDIFELIFSFMILLQHLVCILKFQDNLFLKILDFILRSSSPLCLNCLLMKW